MKRTILILLALMFVVSARAQDVDLTQKGADFSPDSQTNQMLWGSGWFIDFGSYPDPIDTSNADTITLNTAPSPTNPNPTGATTDNITPGPGGDACLWVFGGTTKGSFYVTLDLFPSDGGLLWMYGYLTVYIFPPVADPNNPPLNPEPWVIWNQPISASWKSPSKLSWTSGEVQKIPSGCTVICTFSGVAVGWRTLLGPTLYAIAPCTDSMILP